MSKSNEERLHGFVEEGDAAQVKTLLAEHPDLDINSEDPRFPQMKNKVGYTPFYRACKNNHVEVVKLLLARDDLNLNTKTKWGRTPFHWACLNNHVEVVKLLLARDDLDFNSKNTNGDTPFHEACQYNRVGVVKLLLACDDLDLNSRNSYCGHTPFHRACNHNHVEVVKLLLTRDDLDLNAKNNEGKTALDLAVEMGNAKTVKVLLGDPRVEVDFSKVFGWAWAIEDAEVLKVLLERKDVDLKSAEFAPAVAKAVEKGDAEMVKILLERKDFVLKSAKLTPALAKAVEKGYVELVKIFGEREDFDIFPALAAAVRRGSRHVKSLGDRKVVDLRAPKYFVALTAETQQHPDNTYLREAVFEWMRQDTEDPSTDVDMDEAKSIPKFHPAPPSKPFT